jgi:hypothetical protein
MGANAQGAWRQLPGYGEVVVALVVSAIAYPRLQMRQTTPVPVGASK